MLSSAEIAVIIEAIKSTNSAYENIYNLMAGKEKIGEFPMKDKWGRFWQIKVRKTTKRDRYLKFEALFDKNIEIKASVDGKYKPYKYIPISLEAWNLFGIYSQTKDSYLTIYVEDLLNELVCR